MSNIGLIVFALGDQLLLDRLLGVGKRRVGLVHLRFGLRYAGLGRGVVEFGQQLSFMDTHALLDEQLDQDAAGLRRDLRFMIGDQRRGAVVAGVDRVVHGLRHFDRYGVGAGLFGLLGLRCRATAIAGRKRADAASSRSSTMTFALRSFISVFMAWLESRGVGVILDYITTNCKHFLCSRLHRSWHRPTVL